MIIRQTKWIDDKIIDAAETDTMAELSRLASDRQREAVFELMSEYTRGRNGLILPKRYGGEK